MLNKWIRQLRPLALFVAALVVIGFVSFSHVFAAEDRSGLDLDNFGSPRQFYSDWIKTPEFYFRTYYYKPSPNYAGYKHQFVIFTPDKPDYMYYYNPYNEEFWGRIKTFSKGEPTYSFLEEVDRKPTLSAILETAFPPFGPLPLMPEVTDNLKMDLPPDDAPSVISRLVNNARLLRQG